jgi:general secretion pathway protein I
MSGRDADSCARSQRAASRGFTLIEVLAALVIVALGMMGVIEAVTQSAKNGAYLREKTLAHWIAMNVVTEQRLQPEPPPVTERSDDVEFAGQRWRWTMRVTQTEVESLRRMDVSVRAADAPEETALATVTGFYGTAVGAAGGGVLDWSGAQSAQDGDEDDGDDGDDKQPSKEDGGTATNPQQPGSPTPSPPPEQPPPEDDE